MTEKLLSEYQAEVRRAYVGGGIGAIVEIVFGIYLMSRNWRVAG